MSEYTEDYLLSKISELVQNYGESSGTMSDEAVGEMRGVLSTASYLLVEAALEPAYKDLVANELALDRIEAELYKEHFAERSASKAQSVADTLARKDTRSDERYLTAAEKAASAKTRVQLLNRLLDQANHVLNSMSRRSRY